MAKRRTFSPEFKAQVVLEVLTGVKSGAQVCREHRIKDSVLSRWKQEFVERAPQLFARGDRQSQEEERIADLERLPAQRYDTVYRETRHVSRDGYVEVRGNRYSVPGHLTGKSVTVWIGLDDTLRIYHDDELAASHGLRPVSQGWVTVSEHHRELWRNALQVEPRPLDVYEAVASWS